MVGYKVIKQPVGVVAAEKLACCRTAAQFLQARAQGGSTQSVGGATEDKSGGVQSENF